MTAVVLGFVAGAVLMALGHSLFRSPVEADRREKVCGLESECANWAKRLQHAVSCEQAQREAREAAELDRDRARAELAEAQAVSVEWHARAVAAEQELAAQRVRVLAALNAPDAK